MSALVTVSAILTHVPIQALQDTLNSEVVEDVHTPPRMSLRLLPVRKATLVEEEEPVKLKGDEVSLRNKESWLKARSCVIEISAPNPRRFMRLPLRRLEVGEEEL